MKKIFIILAVFFFGLNAIAQDSLLVNKHGSVILPQKGDIAVGFDADPFLFYIGNMFNGNTNNNLNLGDNTLHFRYFLKDNQAIRLRLRIASTKNVNNFYIVDDAARAIDPLSRAQVEDRVTDKNRLYNIGVGYQIFRGSKRLKGFYGADIAFSYSQIITTYEYGNQMSELNPSPTTHFGLLSTRNLEVNNGAYKTIGIGVFAGAEYYFMPKICLGAELGLSYGHGWGSQGNTKGEQMVLSQLIKFDRADAPGNSNSTLNTAFPYTYGSLYLMIHF